MTGRFEHRNPDEDREEQPVGTESTSAEHRDALVISDAGDVLVLRPLHRTHPSCSDYWDGNWLQTSIELHAGSFRGMITADLRTVELATLRKELGRLFLELEGKVSFDTLEHWIELEIIGDGRGHFELHGILHDGPGARNQMHWCMHFDQTSIPGMLAALDRIATKFPIVGAPDA